jgi:hypothetical protein
MARKWLQWVAAALILLVAFGYFVVRPLAERVLQGAIAVVGAIAQGAAVAAQMVYADACHRVELSPEARALLGDPLVCAPIEDVQWLEPPDNQHLAFQFKVSGPRGDGEVHVVAAADQTGMRITSLDVTGPTETIALPVMP